MGSVLDPLQGPQDTASGALALQLSPLGSIPPLQDNRTPANPAAICLWPARPRLMALCPDFRTQLPCEADPPGLGPKGSLADSREIERPSETAVRWGP